MRRWCDGGTVSSHSWSGAFIFMPPVVLEWLVAPPHLCAPWYLEVGVDLKWIFAGWGKGTLMQGNQATAGLVIFRSAPALPTLLEGLTSH